MNGVALGDRAAYVEDGDVVVLADLHVGRDESSAVSLPLGEAADLRERLGRCLSRFEPETVVVAGDVVHTFGGVSDRSREILADLDAACAAAGVDLELVAGNHDAALSTAWDGEVHAEYAVGGDATPRTVVCHGHEEPAAAADRYLFGHVHPTITIEGDRRPCFLYGAESYREADVVCLPAFTRLAPGVAVGGLRAGETASPLIPDPGRLEPIVYDPNADERFRFPPLETFREAL